MIFFYGERYYFGNPGNYETYFFSTNESGYMNDYDWATLIEAKTESIDDPMIQSFRENAIINTYAIAAPIAYQRDIGFIGFGSSSEFFIGPDYNQVRLISSP